MPIPTNPSECIPKMKGEGKPQDQAVAICLNKQRTGKVVKDAKLLIAQIEFSQVIQKKTKTFTALKEAGITEIFNIPSEEKHKFHAYFLIKGDEVNKNEWGVVDEFIPDFIQSFEGRPFLVTSSDFNVNSVYGDKYLHPNIKHFENYRPELVEGLDPENFEDVLNFQETWKVADIVKVLYDPADDYWKALIEPLPEFKEKPFPPFCSCAIFQEDMSEPADKITKAKGVHIAGLKDRPAYGDKAIFEGTCNDTLGKCTKQFTTPQSLFVTQMKLSKTKIASLLSTDNPKTNVVPVFGEKRKKKKSY